MPHLFRFMGQKSSDLSWSLEAFEIEHARKVLKLKIGDEVEVMDGRGSSARGRVNEISKDLMTVAASNQTFEERHPYPKAVAIGALKPGDFDEILPGLIEWGLDEIHVFQQTDTAKFRTADKARERWHRIATAAIKQSKRSWLPKIEVHDSLQVMLSSLSRFDQKFVLDASGDKGLSKLARISGQSVVAIVGGERGLEGKEISECQSSGFFCVNFGPHILRAKTAALGVATILGNLE